MKLKLNNKLEIAIHYLWFCQIDISNIRILNNVNQLKNGIAFPVFGENIEGENFTFDIIDRINFPLIGTKDLLIFRLIFESFEKLLKASIIIENFHQEKEEIIISDGHSLQILWNNLPEKIVFTKLSMQVKIKPELIRITDIENFFKLDYNLLRYGLDKNFQVSNTFTFEIEKFNLDLLIDKIESLSRTLGTAIYSSKYLIGQEPTGEKFPRVTIEDSNGNRLLKASENSIIKVTNEKRNCI
ncbi:hypothetical protein JWG41_16420 [Leptospira sp. 201903075]|uniref:hypothetical protein n=1 Tax=Leptospira chreensis TaxID=2810035 RepID=UPI0019659B12|nr:hypothetical protein [Leptospira chreensis]MBM9592035.1 hypothetical protein [Leptospira chreensis]